MDFVEWLEHVDYQHFSMQPAAVVRRALHMAWQASRENQQEYQKYEFCRADACNILVGNDKEGCAASPEHCKRTAKEFHHWLKENGYRIVRD